MIESVKFLNAKLLSRYKNNADFRGWFDSGIKNEEFQKLMELDEVLENYNIEMEGVKDGLERLETAIV